LAECFPDSLTEPGDDRQPESVPGAPSIWKLANGGDVGGAINAARNLVRAVPDFHFGYLWLGILYCSAYSTPPKHDQARLALHQGIRSARSSVALCAQLGQCEFEAGRLPEAVKWWIRSVSLQANGSVSDAGPFPYLRCLAAVWGFSELDQRLKTLEARAGAWPPMLLSADTQRELVGMGQRLDRDAAPAVVLAVKKLESRC
jgi:tetratricopeptide (TPR) repeat protein